MAQNWNKRGGHIKPETGNTSFLFNAMHKNVILLEKIPVSDRIVLQVENFRGNVPFKTYPNPAKASRHTSLIQTRESIRHKWIEVIFARTEVFVKIRDHNEMTVEFKLS